MPFNRTPEGLLDFRRFGGTLYHRTAFAGATTGQQLLYALDEQVRRYESEGKVKKYEVWEFLSAVLDGNSVCRGICAMDLRTMEVRTFPADAVIIAPAATAPSLASPRIRWSAPVSAVRALPAGRLLRERRIHPGASHLDSRRRQAAADVGIGARRRRRVWVPETAGDKRDRESIPESERWYFLEEWYPKYGNLVPRDVATRAIHKVVYEHNLGIDGQPMVYLDVTHIDRARSSTGSSKAFSKFTRSLWATTRAKCR